MEYDQTAVRAILDQARVDNRTALTAAEGKRICDAYGIPTPRDGIARSADEAVALAADLGFPVVLKIVSPDILHKTEAGGVLMGLASAEDVAGGYATILANAQAYKPDADITGVQVQEMLTAAQEVIIGAVTDPSFGRLVAFGLGGVLVEVLRDVTFRLAPTTRDEALSMLDGIAAAPVLRGVRGAEPVGREALVSLIQRVSALVAVFPEVVEVDCNHVFASPCCATAVDVRILVDFEPAAPRQRFSQEDILRAMSRIMKPQAV